MPELYWPVAVVFLGLMAWEAWRRTLATRQGKLADKFALLEIEIGSLKTSRDYQRGHGRDMDDALEKVRALLRSLETKTAESRDALSERVGKLYAANADLVNSVGELAGKIESVRSDKDATLLKVENEIRILHERSKAVHGDLAKFSELTMKEFERQNGVQSIKNVAANLAPSASMQTGSKPF